MPNSWTPIILIEVPPMLKITAARVPQAPQTPCTEMAPTGSSILILSKKSTESTTMTPPAAPMMTALSGVTEAQGAVMATSPAKAPFKLMPISGLPNLIQEVTMARTAPAAAARLVLTKIIAMSLLAAVVDPGLNPNHPSQRIKTPRATSGMLWPKIGLILPSLVYFPILGPSTMVPARAA